MERRQEPLVLNQPKRLCRIALVTIADLPEGGGNTYRLRMLARALAFLGHQVSIWNEHALGIVDQSFLRSDGEVEGVPYRYALGSVERSSGFRSIGQKVRAVRTMVGWLKDALQNKAIDVLWFNNLSFYDTWPMTVLARRSGLKTVQSYEDERQEQVSTSHLSVARRLFAINSRMGDRWCPPQSDAIVVISEYLRKKYASLSGTPEKVHIIPTIIDCREWEFPDPEESRPPLLFYAGSFGEQDEMELILDALAALHEKGRRFRTVLLGDNIREPERVERLRHRIRDSRLSEFVEMPGFVSRAEVKRRMAEAHILLNLRCSGAWAESGLSTKLSEYLASGRLVVATDVGDVGKYLKNEESALLLPPRPSCGTLVDVLDRALMSAEMRRRIGRAGREVAERSFNLPVVAEKLEAVLANLV